MMVKKMTHRIVSVLLVVIFTITTIPYIPAEDYLSPSSSIPLFTKYGQVARDALKIDRLVDYLREDREDKNKEGIMAKLIKDILEDVSNVSTTMAVKIVRVIRILMRTPWKKARDVCNEVGISRDELLRIYKIIRSSDVLQDILINHNRDAGTVYEIMELLKDPLYLKKYFNSYEVVYPLVAEFHPGEWCPNSCTFCYSNHDIKCPRKYPDRGYGREPLPPDRARALVNGFADNGTKEIWVSGGLEPLTAKNVTISILKAAHEKGLRTKLYTNGHLFDKKVMETAINCDWVRFSINGITPEMFERVERFDIKRYSLEEVINSVKEFVKLKKERQAKVSIGMSYLIVPDPQNYKDIVSAIEFAYNLGLDFIDVRVDMGGKARKFNDEEIGEIMRQVETIKRNKEDGVYGNMRISLRGINERDLREGKVFSHIEKARRCRARFPKMVINPYGVGFICDYLEHPVNASPELEVGDFSKESIESVLKRSKEIEYEPEVCRKRGIGCFVHEKSLNILLEKFEEDLRFGVSIEEQPFVLKADVITIEEFMKRNPSGGASIVIGGSGYVGSHVVDELLKNGGKVVIPVRTRDDSGLRRIRANVKNENLYMVNIGDLVKGGDITAIERLVQQAPVIYHLAAQSSINIKDFDHAVETFATNGMLTGIITYFAEKYNKKVVYTSSAHIYLSMEDIKDEIVSEDSPLLVSGDTMARVKKLVEAFDSYLASGVVGSSLLEFVKGCLIDNIGSSLEDLQKAFPEGIYNVSKLIGEIFVKKLRKGNGISLRLTNVYGGKQDRGVLRGLIDDISKGRDISVTSATRDFVHVEDVARAIVSTAEKDFSRNEVFIVANGNSPTSVEDLANEILSRINTGSKIGRREDPDVLYAPRFNISKARENLGFSPRLLTKGLDEILGPPVYPKEIALIGLGRWGHGVILGTLRKNFPGLKVHAVCGANHQEMKEMYNGDSQVVVYRRDELDLVLNNPRVKAVVIATQFVSHYELVKRALLMGKHVFVEKPFTKGSHEAKELIKMAQERKLILMVGYEFMYDPNVNLMKIVLDKKLLGKVNKVELSMLNPLAGRRLDMSSNVIEDLGVHMFSILQLLFGQKQVKNFRLDMVREEAADINFTYGDIEVEVRIDRDYQGEQRDRRIRIYGEKGNIVLDYQNERFEEGEEFIQTVRIGLNEKTPVALEFEAFFKAVISEIEPVASDKNVYWIDELKDELRRDTQILVNYLAQRDELPQEPVDVLMVFGNEDLEVPIKAAELYMQGKADRVMFIGGIGHSTENLREGANKEYEIQRSELDRLSEAEILEMIFKKELKKRGMNDEEISKIKISIERSSKDCGENVRFAMEKLGDEKINIKSAILVHKPSLARRIGATFHRWVGETIEYWCYCPYVPQVDEMSEEEFERYTNEILEEVGRLKSYSKPRYNYISASKVVLPESVIQADYRVRKRRNPHHFIESNRTLVGTKINKGDVIRTDVDLPIQVQAGSYRKGSPLSVSSKRYQGVFYLVSGGCEVKTEDRVININPGDIISLYADSKIVFTEDSIYYAFMQTDSSSAVLEPKEDIQSGDLPVDILRDSSGDLIASIYRRDNEKPTKMVMITPRSAGIGVGVKLANGYEKTHRHEKDGKSRMEALVCKKGSFTAYLADKDGKEPRKVEVREGEVIVNYPDTFHGFYFNNAEIIVILQDPRVGPDKVSGQLEYPSARDVWDSLYKIPGARLEELASMSTVKGQSTMDHVKGLVEFEYALSQWRKRGGSLEEVRKIILDRKDPKVTGLSEEKIDEVFNYYKSIPEYELWLLRFAIVLHDIGKIRGQGEDSKASLDISRPVIEGLVEKGLFSRDEGDVILALIYLHNTLHTMHFGETVPQDIEDYLTRNNINKGLYYRLAPILYLADVASVRTGMLSDGHLSNALFFANPEGIKYLIQDWARVRIFLGFCGESNIIIDFNKLQGIEEKEYIKDSLEHVRNIELEGYRYLMEEFLQRYSSFAGHAVFIFRHMQRVSQRRGDKVNSLIKFLYLLSKLHKKIPQFNMVLFTPTEDEFFAEVLGKLLDAIDLEGIRAISGPIDIGDFTNEFHIVVRLDNDTLVIDTKETIGRFINRCEKMQKEKLDGLARIITQKGGKGVVLIGGQTCSGKTPTADYIAGRISACGRNVVKINMDNYYLSEEEIREKELVTADGEADFDSPKALDLDLLNEHIKRLLAGEVVEIPQFDFVFRKRMDRGIPVCLGDNGILIIEGLYALHPAIKNNLPKDDVITVATVVQPEFKVGDFEVSSRDLILLRRLVRDFDKRAWTVVDTLKYWPIVERHMREIDELLRGAQYVVNTATVYELPIIKRRLLYMLLANGYHSEISTLRDTVDRLIKILQVVPDVEITQIPEDSILREFITPVQKIQSSCRNLFSEDVSSRIDAVKVLQFSGNKDVGIRYLEQIIREQDAMIKAGVTPDWDLLLGAVLVLNLLGESRDEVVSFYQRNLDWLPGELKGRDWQERIRLAQNNYLVQARYEQMYRHFMENGIDLEKQREMVRKFSLDWNSYDVIIGGPFMEDFSKIIGDRFLRSLQDLIPQEKLFAAPLNEMHCTIYNPCGISKEGFGDRLEDVLGRMNGVLENTNPFDIYWEGVNIGENGTVVLKGYALDNTIFDLRKRLADSVGIKDRGIPNMIHITLARIIEPLTNDEIEGLRQWLRENNNIPVGVMHIDMVKIVWVSKSLGAGNMGEERVVELGVVWLKRRYHVYPEGLNQIPLEVAYDLKDSDVYKKAERNVEEIGRVMKDSDREAMEERLRILRRLKELTRPDNSLKGFVDLHHHSFYSDGMYSPSYLIYDAWRKGMKAIGIVDHNTFEHFEETVRAAEIFKGEIMVIPGVEFDTSVDFGNEGKTQYTHIVGYFSCNSVLKGVEGLNEWLDKIKRSDLYKETQRRLLWNAIRQEIHRQRFNQSRAAKEKGWEITVEDLLRYYPCGHPNISFVGVVLMDKYPEGEYNGKKLKEYDVKELAKILGHNVDANSVDTDGKKVFLVDAVEVARHFDGSDVTFGVPLDYVLGGINGLGGFAVLPHPIEIRNVPPGVQKELKGIKGRDYLEKVGNYIRYILTKYPGFNGVEVFMAKHSREEMEYFSRLVDELNILRIMEGLLPLFKSISSDSHNNEYEEGPYEMGVGVKSEEYPNGNLYGIQAEGKYQQGLLDAITGIIYPDIDKTIAFAMIKPDGFSMREEIIEDLKRNGFEVLLRIDTDKPLDRRLMETFYAEHRVKRFFKPLIDYITSGPVVLLVLKGGEEAWSRLRKFVGKTDGSEEGTLRHKYGVERAIYDESGERVVIIENKIHCSDSFNAAVREFSILLLPTTFEQLKRCLVYKPYSLQVDIPSGFNCNLLDIGQIEENLSRRNWFWRMAVPEVRKEAIRRIRILQGKLADIQALDCFKELLCGQEVVAIYTAGSYPWHESPGDIDIHFVVKGERRFEIRHLFPEDVDELGISLDSSGRKINDIALQIFGTDNLEKAAKDEDVSNGADLQRKLLTIYGNAVQLAGIDLFENTRPPVEDFHIYAAHLRSLAVMSKGIKKGKRFYEAKAIESCLIEEIEEKAMTELELVLGGVDSTGADTGNLNILDAHLFSKMSEVKVSKLLDIMNGKDNKAVVVVFNAEDEWVGKLAEEKGILVVEDIPEDVSPEWIVIDEFLRRGQAKGIDRQDPEVNKQAMEVSVMSSIDNISRWRPGLNAMVRYIVCDSNLTISGILRLYNKLPEDIRKAMGINREEIEREKVMSGDRFDKEKLEEELRFSRVIKIGA